MRSIRSIAAVLLAFGLLLSAAGIAMAKGDAVVTLDEPLPTDAQPGSKVTIAWTLDMPDGSGGTIPFNAEGAFVRFTPVVGKPVEVVAQQDRDGHYRATVTIPDGGLGSAVFGLKGEVCNAGGGCQRSDMFFPLATEAGQAGPDPVAAPVLPVASIAPVAAVAQPAAVVTAPRSPDTPTASAPVDLTLLPLVAFIGFAGIGFGVALALRGRGRSAAA